MQRSCSVQEVRGAVIHTGRRFSTGTNVFYFRHYRMHPMSTTLPFILHILVADGDPDGLRVVERSN